MRTLRRDISKRLKRLPASDVCAFCFDLLQTGKVPRFFVYELIQYHSAAAASLNSGKLRRLGKGINSWVDVDCFSCFLAGPAWRENQVSDSLILEWARSKDRWWRRAALVSTVALNCKARGGQGDIGRTLQICSILVDDRDDMVVKALSWALRELSKRDREAVSQFVVDYENRLAPRVRREVRNKLITGLKNP